MPRLLREQQVQGDQAAEAVPDDVDLPGGCLLEQGVEGCPQTGGRSGADLLVAGVIEDVVEQGGRVLHLRPRLDQCPGDDSDPAQRDGVLELVRSVQGIPGGDCGDDAEHGPDEPGEEQQQEAEADNQLPFRPAALRPPSCGDEEHHALVGDLRAARERRVPLDREDPLQQRVVLRDEVGHGGGLVGRCLDDGGQEENDRWRRRHVVRLLVRNCSRIRHGSPVVRASGEGVG
jgi:hypothetical protein